MKKLFPALLILPVLFIYSGCSLKRPDVTKAALMPPEQVWEKISRRDEGEISFKTLSKIKLYKEGERYVQKMAVLMKRPSFLRIESIPPVGLPNFFLSINKELLKVFLPTQGEFYIGPASSSNLALFLPVDLKVEDIVSILVGTIPPKRERNETKLKGSREGKHYRLDVFSGSHRKSSAWVDPSSFTLARYEAYGEDNNIIYSVDFSDYRKVGEVLFPFNVTITPEDTDKYSLAIEYLEVQASLHLDMNVFDLALPPGLKPQYLK